MDQTRRSSEATLIDQTSNGDRSTIFACYGQDVPHKPSQAAHATEPGQAYKAYQFCRQNEEQLMLDVINDVLGYIYAVGDGNCWHMHTLFGFEKDKKVQRDLQNFVSFTAKNSTLFARYELVKTTIRTFNTQKKLLIQHKETYLSCATNTKVLSFNLLISQINVSDQMITYLVLQVRIPTCCRL